LDFANNYNERKVGAISVKKKSKKKLWLYKKSWLSHGNVSAGECAECKGLLFYFYKYDALCCPRCNIWHDSKCSDVNCEFCANRPETPQIGLCSTNHMHFDKKIFHIKKYSHRLKRSNRRKLKLLALDSQK